MSRLSCSRSCSAISRSMARSRFAAISDVRLLEHLEEIRGGLHFVEPRQVLRVLAELRDLAEDGQILIRDLDRGGYDQEQVMHRLVVHRAERQALLLASIDDSQPVDDERAAVGDRHALSDSGGSEVLPLLEQTVELFGLLADAQQVDHLPQGFFLRLRLEIQSDLVLAEELDELHGIGIPAI